MKNFLRNDKNNNFDKWYSEVVLQSGLIDYGLVKGTIVLDVFGLLIWKKIQAEFCLLLNKNNIYPKEIKVPTLIPYNIIDKEVKHLNGFLPELYQITTIGKKELSVYQCLRPTSEVAFCNYFKNKLNIYKQLPFEYIQWCNIFRNEKNTKPFLRNSEFYWHEGHTLHEKHEDSINYCLKIHKIYIEFLKKYCLFDVYGGKKTESEKFFGARSTYTCEIFMPNGNALQSATSHDLGQNFSKIYNIKYQDNNNKYSVPFQTSWGFSTRIMGGLVMNFGDNNGLILPSKISPFKIGIVINNKSALLKKQVDDYVSLLTQILNNNNINFNIYSSNIGFSYNKKECILNGVPLILEINDICIQNKEVIIQKRFNLERKIFSFNEQKLILLINNGLKESDQYLIEKSKSNFQNCYGGDNLSKNDIVKAISQNKIVKSFVCGSSKDEIFLKEKCGGTIRCILKENVKSKNCVFCDKQAKYIILASKAY